MQQKYDLYETKNTRTGEIVANSFVKNDGSEEFKTNVTKKLTYGQINYLNKSDELKSMNAELGGFINMCYVSNKLLFNELNIDRANISRLIYLATYIDYNNRQENVLIKYTKHRTIETMTKNDIKDILKLSDRAFANFMKDMKNNNLIYEVFNKIYISREYFSKGKCNFKSGEYTRIYIYPTRSLYMSCTSRQHKQLSYIYQLIPFMNKELNIICKNPNETDISKLEKLTLKDICELLGLSTEQSVMRRLRDDLLKFYIKINGKKYFFLSYARVLNGYGLKDYFIINPNVCWSGNNMDNLKDTLSLCYFK